MWEWLSPVVSFIGNIVDNVVDWFSTEDTNETNEAINERNLDYNTALTQQQWERDDTAHQREVADLKAAGLSPLANTTGAPVTQGHSAPNPIAMQAPQLNTNSMINAAVELAKLQEDKRHNQSTEENRATELQNQAEEIKQRFEEIKIQDKKLEEEIRHNLQLEKIQVEELAELVRNQKKNNKLRQYELELQAFQEETEKAYVEIKKACGGQDIPYVLCSTPEEYQVKFEARQNGLKFLAETLGPTSEAQGTSNTSSFGGGFGATASVAATGGGGNANFNKSDSGSDYNSKNWSEKQRVEWEKFLHDYPVPIADFDNYFANLKKKQRNYPVFKD